MASNRFVVRSHEVGLALILRSVQSLKVDPGVVFSCPIHAFLPRLLGPVAFVNSRRVTPKETYRDPNQRKHKCDSLPAIRAHGTSPEEGPQDCGSRRFTSF